MPERTLDDWLDWQTRLHPSAIDLGLERVAAVWSRLGHGTLPGPVVTVGGTNGKGSCAALLEAMASAGGYRTACYTSPHLLRYNERIRLDGRAVDDRTLCDAFARVEAARAGVPLTYFEFGTLAALELFARARPELTILEVGLGGRLDAVNLIDADVAVVTSIGLDHTAWLGDTLEAIAIEKAGIFRAGRPAVIGQRDAPATLRAAARAVGARPRQLGREFELETTDGGWVWSGPGPETDGETADGPISPVPVQRAADGARTASGRMSPAEPPPEVSEGWRGIAHGQRRLSLPRPTLRGPFQLENAAAAIAALDALAPRLPLPVNAIRLGLQRARLPGRFQVIAGTPTWILDVAHNGAAAAALAANLRDFACQGRVRAVLAVLSDKDPEAILAPLAGLVDRWFLAGGGDPRSMPVEELARRLNDSLPADRRESCPDLDAALDAGAAASASGDALLVLGSFTTVAHALRRLGRSGDTD